MNYIIKPVDLQNFKLSRPDNNSQTYKKFVLHITKETNDFVIVEVSNVSVFIFTTV